MDIKRVSTAAVASTSASSSMASPKTIIDVKDSNKPAASASSASGTEGKRMAYYSSEEVARHSVSSDCWVSYSGRVYDLTPLIAQYKGLLVQPILKFAGQDISHWFDPKTKEPKQYI